MEQPKTCDLLDQMSVNVGERLTTWFRRTVINTMRLL
jgi:hypothetical protein